MAHEDDHSDDTPDESGTEQSAPDAAQTSDSDDADAGTDDGAVADDAADQQAQDDDTEEDTEDGVDDQVAADDTPADDESDDAEEVVDEVTDDGTDDDADDQPSDPVTDQSAGSAEEPEDDKGKTDAEDDDSESTDDPADDEPVDAPAAEVRTTSTTERDAPDPATRKRALLRLAACCLLAGMLAAALAFPVVGGAGFVVSQVSDSVMRDSEQMTENADVPTVSTMVDANGDPIAWLYAQRRWVIPAERIPDTMKLAIVSIEDRRFAEHNGVDLSGTLTGLLGYLQGNTETRGGSTIEQQYVKNYNLLVKATTDAERKAAIEVSPVRKLREIRMALALDKTVSKPEILARYLNLVSFGNGAYGVQDAARTYFGIDARQLNWQQAALLAGIVQSTSALDPYTNPEGALERRNLVLDTMIANLPDQADQLRAAKDQPLGVLPAPAALPQGCIAAADRAFFCEYALQYLARAGISKDDIARNGYLIQTNLNPMVQGNVKNAVDNVGGRNTTGVASVMTVIKPGKDAHRVIAMADNHTFGLDLKAGETVQPQPYSLVGDGAGSTFKIFTTAAALEMGMGINTQLDVPAQFRGTGLGSSNLPGCPPNTWCVKNAGGYAGKMSVTDALAQSPNTAFANLIAQVGVPRTVDMAVRLGLRSYAEPGTARAYDPNTNESIADYVKRLNLGSFTLGPLEVNAVEMSNVAATLASGGMWCPPSPIAKLIDRNGREVSLNTPKCEQVVPEGLANTLANALGKDHTSGTAAGAAGSVGWGLPMAGKTGTTESHRSSAFVGFTNQYAAANYVFDASPKPSGLCSYPLRKCDWGNLFGGNEPARTWFAAMSPIANALGPVTMPPTDPRYVDGGPGSEVPTVVGLNVEAAKKKVRDAGFKVADQPTAINSYSAMGVVVGTTPKGKTMPGSTITINTSNGVAPAPVYVPPQQTYRDYDDTEPEAPPPPVVDALPPNIIEIPGLPPITLPPAAPPPAPAPVAPAPAPVEPAPAPAPAPDPGIPAPGPPM